MGGGARAGAWLFDGARGCVVRITGVEITGRRNLVVEHGGRSEWTVTEFDGGNRMLVVWAAGTQFNAHFSAEQWAEFQKLIAGVS